MFAELSYVIRFPRHGDADYINASGPCYIKSVKKCRFGVVSGASLFVIQKESRGGGRACRGANLNLNLI